MARFAPILGRLAIGLLALAALVLGAGAAQAAMVDAPPAPLDTVEPAAHPDAVIFPSRGTPTVEVRDGHHVDLRTSPGGDVVAKLSDTTEFGSPTVLSVVARRGDWVGVPTQLRPNGELGWLELNEKDLRFDSVSLEIRIDLSDYSAELLRGGKVERTMPIGIGAPGTDTPTGRFSVTDEIQSGLNPTYGCCLLALSATQPNLPPGWTGGNRMAIHGTSLPLGEANSTGCVHAGEDDLHALIESVPLGTPVIIEK
jgi:hypothetical protein